MRRRQLLTLGLGLSGVAATLTATPAAAGQGYPQPGIAPPAPSLTPIFTSVTTPLLVGGTLPSSTLTIRATSGAGAGSEAVVFQLGNGGSNEVMRLRPEVIDGQPTSIVDVKGNLLVQGPGDSVDQSTAIVVKAGFPGIDFYNTNYPTPVVQRRMQILNSDDSDTLEFNYFTGEGTTVQTGWQMDPANGIFRATAGAIEAKFGFVTLGTTGWEFIGFKASGGFLQNGSGKLNLVNASWTVGVGLDVATDSVLKIRTRAQSGYATVDALGYRVSGVPGASKAAGPVTSITVVNGLITAIS
jgi:hypothetical protein